MVHVFNGTRHRTALPPKASNTCDQRHHAALVFIQFIRMIVGSTGQHRSPFREKSARAFRRFHATRFRWCSSHPGFRTVSFGTTGCVHVLEENCSRPGVTHRELARSRAVWTRTRWTSRPCCRDHSELVSVTRSDPGLPKQWCKRPDLAVSTSTETTNRETQHGGLGGRALSKAVRLCGPVPHPRVLRKNTCTVH